MFLDEGDGVVGETIRQIFACFPVGHGGILIGCEVAWWAAHGIAADVERKALFLRAEVEFGDALIVAGTMGEVPLADVGCGVACGGEPFCDRDFFEGQVADVVSLAKGRAGQGESCRVSGGVVGDAEAGRRLTGHHGGTSRGADGRGGIGVGEAHAFGGEAVQSRGIQMGVAIAMEVPPAEVVCHDDDDVGFADFGVGAAGDEGG